VSGWGTPRAQSRPVAVRHRPRSVRQISFAVLEPWVSRTGLELVDQTAIDFRKQLVDALRKENWKLSDALAIGKEDVWQDNSSTMPEPKSVDVAIHTSHSGLDAIILLQISTDGSRGRDPSDLKIRALIIPASGGAAVSGTASASEMDELVRGLVSQASESKLFK
jgi:hypothetical protein